jgi:hypothetical protein
MDKRWRRRDILKQMAAASTVMLLPRKRAAANTALQVAGRDSVIQISSVSAATCRLSVLPAERG